MPTERLMRALAASGHAGNGSPEGMLSRVSDLATICLPGCSGAVLYARRDEEEYTAASHPHVATLLERQLDRDDDPLVEALRQQATIRVSDTMDDRRWPAFCADAVAHGIHTALVLPAGTEYEGVEERDVTICVLYGARGHALDQPAAIAMAALLTEQAAVALGNDETVTEARESAVQSQQALETRGEIEQAKGMIMQALDCGPDEAFEELRRTSQKSNRKLHDVAHLITTERREWPHR